MHEVRFPNMYILSSIIYFILLLITIVVLAIKSIGLSKVRQTLSNKFAIDCGTAKIKYHFFYLDFFFYFGIKKVITSWLER